MPRGLFSCPLSNTAQHRTADPRRAAACILRRPRRLFLTPMRAGAFIAGAVYYSTLKRTPGTPRTLYPDEEKCGALPQTRKQWTREKGEGVEGWRSHRRRSVPADCIGSATTATADHARPGTVSGPAADHRRTATTTGTEGQRTGSGPGSRRLSSGCTRAAWAVVAFTTKKGGNCCPNCLLWQQFRHLQQVFALSETHPAAPPPLQWHRLTS